MNFSSFNLHFVFNIMKLLKHITNLFIIIEFNVCLFL